MQAVSRRRVMIVHCQKANSVGAFEPFLISSFAEIKKVDSERRRIWLWHHSVHHYVVVIDDWVYHSVPLQEIDMTIDIVYIKLLNSTFL